MVETRTEYRYARKLWYSGHFWTIFLTVDGISLGVKLMLAPEAAGLGTEYTNYPNTVIDVNILLHRMMGALIAHIWSALYKHILCHLYMSERRPETAHCSRRKGYFLTISSHIQ